MCFVDSCGHFLYRCYYSVLSVFCYLEPCDLLHNHVHGLPYFSACLIFYRPNARICVTSLEEIISHWGFIFFIWAAHLLSSAFEYAKPSSSSIPSNPTPTPPSPKQWTDKSFCTILWQWTNRGVSQYLQNKISFTLFYFNKLHHISLKVFVHCWLLIPLYRRQVWAAWIKDSGNKLKWSSMNRNNAFIESYWNCFHNIFFGGNNNNNNNNSKKMPTIKLKMKKILFIMRIPAKCFT